MSIQIYTVTHVPFTPPEDAIYVPLQVGRALHPDYGYLGDHTGDNISSKNPYYSELTGLYWIWKNHTDADYLGLCHYRRYFLNNSGALMSESDYMDILSKYDVIIARPQIGQYDYHTIYARAHDIRNLEQTAIILQELYPDYYADFQDVTTSNRCYVGNLFVAPRSLFCAYCEWLFTIFSALEKRINTDDYDDYHKRVFGFLSEQLLFVWIKHNRLSYYEAPFGLSQEKAETIELKQALAKYILNKDIAGAYQYLNSVLDRRPDLSLEMSDFNQDLKITSHIINVCRIEQEASLPTLLDFSNDLSILLKHFRLLLSILEHLQDDSVTEKELQYLIDCHVSYKAVLYMLQNFKQFAGNPVTILNQLAVLYADAGSNLTALSFLEEALSLCETDQTTLSNIVAVLQNMGQYDMAAEYRQFLDENCSAKKFVVFMGADIPILDYIAEQYRQALQALGHKVYIFDKHNFEASLESLLSYLKQGLDGAFVFNNACFQMRLQSGESLWDLWHVPCYNVLVDHPMYYYDTLDHAPACGIVICADKYHTDYVKRFYPTVTKSVFLPTAGECLKPYEALKPFTERSIDVLFIGSYKYHDDVSYDAFSKRLELELTSHPYKTFENAVTDCLEDQQSNLSGEDIKLLIQQYRFIDVNTTALFRRKIIETLVNAGVCVTVYGNGWEALEISNHPNFIYKGLISPQEGIKLMEESKIVLNHMAWFKYGASERIFEAMLQGAVSLTDESEYLKAHFTDSENIKFFSLSHLDELPHIVHALLSDPHWSESITENGYRLAARSHTWMNRLEALFRTP